MRGAQFTAQAPVSLSPYSRPYLSPPPVAGTCAAALRAGVPSVPCPVMLDQTSNALRLQEAGCAAEPLPFQRLTAQVHAAAAGLGACLHTVYYGHCFCWVVHVRPRPAPNP